MSTDASPPTSRRQQMMARKQALWTERSSWVEHWREIAEYMQPRAGRFIASDRQRGTRRHNNILDEAAMFAKRTLAAGLMSGMTSPARPWFRLGLKDKELAEYGPVKTWLHKTTELMRAVFAASNTYNALHTLYGELGLFGTAANILLPDYDNVVHHYPLTIGEFALATNHKGQVDTLARELTMTVGQMVTQFGLDACSQAVQNLWRSKRLDQTVLVYHLIQPNPGRDVRKADSRNMRWSSCYFEPAREDWDRMLRDSGFTRFRALTPRWDITSNEVYGESPAMVALGATKQLQHEQLRKGQAIDYQTNPPLQVPTAYEKTPLNRLPGGIMYVDATAPGGGVRSAFDVRLDLNALREDIADVQRRINTAFYADLFLMLANDTRAGITATEVVERHEEKLLALGPVLERLHNELLSPAIDMAFDDCATAGILPEPPEELRGVKLEVHFISVLAQAMRAVAAGGMDRLIGTITSMTNVWPEARHKFNPLQAVDDYADLYGVNPELIVDDEIVQQKVAAEQQAAQAAQAAAAAPMAADAAKTVGDINTQGVQDVMSALQGYSTAVPA